MYFFVGRPQPWKAYLEIYAKNATAFSVGDEVYVGTYGSTSFRATISKVYDSALLLTDVFGSAGVNSAPALGSSLKGRTGGAGGSDTGATAKSGIYRYATEDVPPLPLDNQDEKVALYDELIAAKRITSSFARTVIRLYNWDQPATLSMTWTWLFCYTGGGGQIGRQTAPKIDRCKFYVMNSVRSIQVSLQWWDPSNTTGQNATEEPTVAGGKFICNWSLYRDNWCRIHQVYVYYPYWWYLQVLSSDFMPIVLPANASRTPLLDWQLLEHVMLFYWDAGSGLPITDSIHKAKGDGSNGIVKFVTNGSGTIVSAEIQSQDQVIPMLPVLFTTVLIL